MHLLVSFVSKIVLFIKPPLLKNQLNKKIKVMKRINMESMKHPLMNFVFTIILSTKLPLYLNKMALQNAKTKLLKETMNSVLINLRAPHKLQGEAVLISNYTINKVLRKKIKKKIPYEL